MSDAEHVLLLCGAMSAILPDGKPCASVAHAHAFVTQIHGLARAMLILGQLPCGTLAKHW